MPFFHPKRAKKKTVKGKQYSKEFVMEHGCKVCELKKGVKSPNMPPTGADYPSIYVTGESPGKTEDILNEQFKGESGQLLRRNLKEIFGKEYVGFTRFNNCCRCRPPGNRNPTPMEMDCCRKEMVQDIEKTKPNVILALGGVPLRWIGIKDSIGLWRGRYIPVKVGNHTCWCFITWHPAYLLRREKKYQKWKGFDIWKHAWQLDLKKLQWLLESELVPEYVGPEELFTNLGITEDIDQIQLKLNELKNEEYVAIDIENWPLRPYAKNSKILSVSIGTWDNGVTFPFTAAIKQQLKNFLLQSGKKICQNVKHEMEWFAYIYGPEIIHKTKWEDTMVQGFVLDERKDDRRKNDTGRGLLGLGDLTRIRMGIDIKKYSPIHYRDVRKSSMEDLLKGNGMDRKFTYRLFFIQKELLTGKLLHVYNKHKIRAGSLALAQLKGVPVNRDEVEKHDTKFKNALKKVNEKIMQVPEVKRHIRQFKEFNPLSDTHLTTIFRDYCGFAAVKGTKTKKISEGGYGTDEEALKLLKKKRKGQVLPDLVIACRKWTRMSTRYGREGIEKHLYPDGLIHPSYNHTFASTARLSCDEPNMQNWDKRKNPEVRTIIIPPPGHWMVACDFGQIQVRFIAVESGDKTLIEYCNTDYDFHMDFTEILAKMYPKVIGGRQYLSDRKVMKDLRTEMKNSYDFPKFFGAVDESCARSLKVPVEIINELTEKYFWGRFPGVRDWHNRIDKFYKEYGYIESLLGRQRRAPLNRNKRINSPIQMDESDFVNDATDRLALKGFEEGKPQLQIPISIHDDLTFFIPEDSLEDDIEIIAREMTRIPEDHGFMTVPMPVEISVGKDWYNMEKVGEFTTRDFYDF